MFCLINQNIFNKNFSMKQDDQIYTYIHSIFIYKGIFFLMVLFLLRTDLLIIKDQTIDSRDRVLILILACD